MKKTISKKAQVYGLSSFIYALSIAVILVIGLVGMAKDFEIKSHAANYQLNAISASKIAEFIKKIMDEERSYAFDESAFMIGAFGGQLPTTVSACGAKNNTFMPFIPEKSISYWQSGGQKCIPSDESIVELVKQYGNEIFQAPSETITSALSVYSGQSYNFNYLMKISGYGDNYFVISWFPYSSTGDFGNITIKFPPRNPMVEYSFEPYIHSNSTTPFLYIKHAAEKFVNDKVFDAKFSDSDDKPFPIMVDEDVLIAKKTASANEKNCNTDPYPSDYCTQNASDLDHPFRLLVDYVSTNYPDAPLMLGTTSCATYLDSSKVSNTYGYSCTLYTKYSPSTGQLEIDTKQGTNGFLGCNSGSAGNDSAMKCVMIRSINKLIAEKNSGAYKPDSTNLDWKTEFDTFNLTYTGGQMATSFLYNKTLG
ncbi:MAG: hypothetical protein PHC66_01370 [Candidatus Nanoarchaeia archaeon]|nr:hypothetical protein [Candidatus Nanoarchaeia archaeon]MDD5239192.1 hypothetical protein [Candidatus Nanoarchaeia archaeon]